MNSGIFPVFYHIFIYLISMYTAWDVPNRSRLKLGDYGSLWGIY